MPFDSRHRVRSRYAGLPFLAGLATCMVLFRLVLFDYKAFFTFESLPNHDMYQGAAFFATSMHSMRWTGDIAWWNPVSVPGYGQYAQGLVSPLAPTFGHIVFILWSEIVLTLSVLGVAIPEYVQYLIVTYIVLPFLALLAFAWLCSLLFRSRSTVVLATLAYCLSSVGLWNSAWFYFQEPATTFFLLGSWIHLVQRPGPRSVTLALAASLVQLASVNYWTVYSSWFILIVLGTGALVYPARVRRTWSRVVDAARRRPWPSFALATVMLVVGGLWITLIASAQGEVAHYRRMGTETFSGAHATASIRPVFYLSRTFHPDLESIAPRPLNTFQTMHHAVYVGVFFVPLLLALLFHQWRSLERWIALTALGILLICFAPPPVVWAWEHFPLMNRVRHVFEFYPAFFRTILVLLACASMDWILSVRTKVRSGVALAVLAAGIAGVVLLGGSAFGPLARLGGVPAALLILIPALFVAFVLLRPTPLSRAVLAGGLLFVASADLATYFRLTCQLDSDFTRSYWGVPRPLPAETRDALGRCWEPLDPEHPDRAFFNMPVATFVWPFNKFAPHEYVVESLERAYTWRRDDPFVAFHPEGGTEWMSQPDVESLTELPYQWHGRTYNDWSLAIQVPESGWLSVAQLHDTSWRVKVDGAPVETRRTNLVRSGFHVEAGRHEVEMTYRPLARSLYWPASVALELALIVFGAVGWKLARSPRARIARDPTPARSRAARPSGRRR